MSEGLSAEVWEVEQVLAFAPNPATAVASQSVAVPSKWSGCGCTDQALWGRCIGTGGEPYECVVDHLRAAAHCSCPSRKRPCKHVIALLLMWARGQVPTAVPGSQVVARLSVLLPATSAPTAAPAADPVAPAAEPQASSPAPASTSAGADSPEPSAGAPPPRHDRNERAARMAAGLAELDRWLDDRMRTGLGDSSIAQYSTWDQLAARLVDAQVGGLANRVRRLAGAVGAQPHWHEHVVAELGVLHLLAQSGRRLGDLPVDLADAVGTAIGWQVRQAEVLEGVPITDQWMVMGRSDAREDRIEVRRVWLRGAGTGRWAMVLSFAAYGQSLDTSLEVGSMVHADVYAYPGVLGLRALVGSRHAEPVRYTDVAALDLLGACAHVGASFAAEPWIERVPCCVFASPTLHQGQWVLTDAQGSLPLVCDARTLQMVLACSEGRPVALTVEFTAAGVLPLTVHLADRHVDVGPIADASFVGAR